MGVGGYLLGGGVNVIGTSQRLTSGASNVLQYTMVDAKGDIYKVLVKIYISLLSLGNSKSYDFFCWFRFIGHSFLGLT